jgi:hypothetical protein
MPAKVLVQVSFRSKATDQILITCPGIPKSFSLPLQQKAYVEN